MWYCYILRNKLPQFQNNTYNGSTNNPPRRLRQHNEEIKGGATATSIKVQNGEAWSYVCYVENFPTWNEALKFEWRWKQITRKIQIKNEDIIERRLRALHKLCR